jgi:hypothetical protein
MSLPRWLQLPTLGLEIWLPLTLLLIAFGVGGEPLTNQVLSRSYGTVDKLQADTKLEVKLALPVLFINAEIEKEQGFTTVDVKTKDSELKKLEFQLPVTEFSLVEAAIAQKLQLSPENVRRLVRYQVRSAEE